MILPILLILVALVVERGVTLWSVSEQVAQSRTQAEKQFLTLFPEQNRIVNLRSQVTIASFDKLRSALATDYVVQQDALQKEGDAVSGGVTLRRK
jgi:general secretion pathway protein L